MFPHLKNLFFNTLFASKSQQIRILRSNQEFYSDFKSNRHKTSISQMGILGVVLWFAGLNFILFLMLTGGRTPFEGEQGGQPARAGLPCYSTISDSFNILSKCLNDAI